MIQHLWPRGMQFESPWLLGLLAIPLVIVILELRRRPRTVSLSALPSRFDIPRSWRTRMLWLPPALRFIGLSALVVALARPQQGIGRVETSSEAVAIELVVDRSGSMKAQMDLGGKDLMRIDVVKRVIHDFLMGTASGLKGRGSDLIGLVSFCGYAETVCPPVRDNATLAQLVDTLQLPQYRFEDGTAIGDGLSLAAARLRTAEQDLKNRTDAEQYRELRIKSKVIILLTDGANNRGEIEPLDAAKLAKDWGIKVYTIGIGAGADAYDVMQTPFGEQRVRIQSDVDEPMLREMATMTGGVYRRAQDGDALRAICKEIDSLEKTTVKTVEYVDYSERFMTFAAAGAAALAISTMLASTVLRRAVA
ncbi:MAG: VWA domain-containing protein [Phycisphaerales bacterium]|nr:VWA domain-containing protein [Phycisphaerales bacterium]